jgi:radical SAM superfamily enzyme YgiQ (UPF0313 family)
MKIGYIVFGKTSLCYGLAYCIYKAGLKVDHATEKTARFFDVLLVSIFWWQHIYDLIDFCERARVGKKFPGKTRIVVGGFNSVNPKVFDGYAHVVVVGDGEDVIEKAINEYPHESIYTGNEKQVKYAVSSIDKNEYIYHNEANFARYEIARGCKFKCRFCQLSHVKPYREVNIDSVKSAIDKMGKKIVLFAPNKTSHSNYQEIAEYMRMAGKSDYCPDVRFNDVEKFHSVSGTQIGIEGFSEKLRYSVGKKCSNERLREIVRFIIQRSICEGKKPMLFAGFILDLPGEVKEDIQEFSDTLDSFQAIPNIEKFNLFFIFNLFMPQPFIPLENEPIHYMSEYMPVIRSVLYDRKFKVAVRGRLFSRYSRILSMVATRGGSEFCEIACRIKNEIAPEAKEVFRIKALERLLSGYGGIDAYCGTLKKRHWDCVQLSNNPSAMTA